MPFWRERTAVSGPAMGRMRSAAVSVSNDFTQKRMTSAAERPRTSSTAARRTTDSRAGETVTLIARGEHLTAIQRDGLRIRSAVEGESVVRLAAVEDVRGLSAAEV